ncbi:MULTISPECIES: hypothetical protein [unclassified Enterococcus]|uniref:hypothetical protein n=1 Tax=unclassified Enterococcus TaxID=2608891 RepID=UPI0013EC14EF|nr:MULTISPECIES: hypothetical protein [unclassified Enterococcus]
MLNIYFVFGVPLFLIILYLVFAYVRKHSNIHYLGFILLIISGFMLVFTLQTWQQALAEMDTYTSQAVSRQIGYPVFLIWLPISISGCLVLLNLYRGWRRLQTFRKKNNAG